MTVDEMLSRMSSRELTNWMIFYEFEPFGTEIELLGHAITSSTVANASRKKGQKAYKPEKFMPKFGRKKKQSVKSMIGVAAAFTKLAGGEDKRGK